VTFIQHALFLIFNFFILRLYLFIYHTHIAYLGMLYWCFFFVKFLYESNILLCFFLCILSMITNPLITSLNLCMLVGYHNIRMYSLMIVIKNGDLIVAIVEAIGNLRAPKAAYEINPSILLLMKACVLLSP